MSPHSLDRDPAATQPSAWSGVRAGAETQETAVAVKEAVRARYAQAASSGSCCGAAEPGADGPARARELDLGCGNPLPFAGVRAGDTVLDLGSGSGAEVLRAARMVGDRGRAIGVDMTDEMLELARSNAREAGASNVEFLKGEIESLPLPDASVDVIVSNCVLNLSPDKPAAFREAFRVLRSGGRFVVADVVVEGSAEPPPSWRQDLRGWAGCVSGAMTEAAYASGLREAGFRDVRLDRIGRYGSDACCEQGAGGAHADGCCEHGAGGAHEPGTVSVVSDLISASKP